MITYQVEEWNDSLKNESAPILELHWKEVALDQDRFPLDVDYQIYEQAHKVRKLLICTARDTGRLIGYFAWFLSRHHHYRPTFATTDVYFVIPEYRLSRVPVKLFRFAEEQVKSRGAQKAVSISKLHLDHTKFFKFLGWKPVETVYTKCL